MKNLYFLCAFTLLIVVTTSCGPRRYKCGPYRKCYNSIEKFENKQILKKQTEKTDC